MLKKLLNNLKTLIPFLIIFLSFPLEGVHSATSKFQASINGFACFDGKDNDGDGLIDFPNDLGCVAQNDDSEEDSVPTSTPSDRKKESGSGGGKVLDITVPQFSLSEQFDIVKIKIEPLPFQPTTTSVLVQPVLIPPSPDSGNQSSDSQQDQDQGQRSQESEVSQEDKSAINDDDVPNPSTESTETVSSNTNQPLLPALEIYITPRFGADQVKALRFDEIPLDVPINSPDSPLLPLFITLGSGISGLSLIRIFVIV